MDRRGFLRRFGAASAVGASVALAGCGGGEKDTGQPAPGAGTDDGAATATPTAAYAENVVVGEGWGHETNEDGLLEVTVPVVNEGESATTVNVEVQITAGEETLTDSEEVSLDANEEKTLTFTFDVDPEKADPFGVNVRILRV